MARRALSLTLRLSVIIITALIQYNMSLDRPAAADKISLTPLWDVDDSSDSQLWCSIEERNTTQGTFLLHGSENQTCKIQVSVSLGSYIRIEIPNSDGSNTESFIYIERRGDLIFCSNRFLLFNRYDKVCSSILYQDSVNLNLQGNVGILVSGISALESQPKCPESNADTLPSPIVNQTQDCVNIKGYTSQIKCELLDSHTCYLIFPGNCNATLGNREVIFLCYDNIVQEIHETLIIYPVGITLLYLSYNNIVKMEGRPFHGSKYIQALLLSGNQLVTLDEGIFHELRQLSFLALDDNKLTTLPIGLFDLGNLNTLSLCENQLVTLNESIFYELRQLTVLALNDNKLNTLPSGLFQNLKNLNQLYLYKNQLVTLNESTFHELRQLIVLALNDNKLTTLPSGLFENLNNLNQLYLYTNQLVTLNDSTFHELRQLTALYMDGNQMTILPDGLFGELENLNELSLGNNLLGTLDSHVFNSLHNLSNLIIFDNKLVTLPNGIFDKLSNLKYLVLSNNTLVRLSRTMLHGLFKLKILMLNNNKLNYVASGMFKDTIDITIIVLANNRLTRCPDIKHLTELNFFNLKGNPLTFITSDTFRTLPANSELVVNQHEICECYVPAGVKCSASDNRSPYLTCDRLLSDKALVVLMWLIGLNALGGNIFVLVWRKKHCNNFKVQDILLSNLAMSDSLMGVYMVIVASADVYYGDYFPMHSENWRSGITCRVGGSISIASTQLSIFFLTTISIDRFTGIRYPYSDNRLGKPSTILIATLIWFCSLALGIVPSALSGRNFKFYDNAHVCVGLPLALTKTYTSKEFFALFESGNTIVLNETYSTKFTGLTNGLYFSTALFLVVNCLCYLIILACYIEIVRAVNKSAAQSGRTSDIDEQIRLIRNVTAIVVTDLMCVFPIIVLGILVQTRVIELPPSVYAWSVTVVLPINSAINPYLYTIVEIISNNRKKKVDKQIQQAKALQTMKP